METNKQLLGRRYIPDERDQLFLLKSLLPIKNLNRVYKYWWASGWWGNQGNTPQCVGYSWSHWLNAGPITQESAFMSDKSAVDPTKIYNEAQKIDMWPGEDYPGTSVRAGAAVLKNLGYISSYHWAFDINTIITALLTTGPMVVGTVWKYDMFFPKEGIITATGENMGGHAYLLDGVNIKKKLFRIKNSWGRGWGKNGFAYISFDDMDLLMKDYGEACLAVEILK